MNRLQQLKLLYDETRILFDDGFSEQEAFNHLSSDQRFDSIRRTDIHYFYQKLQAKLELDKEQKDLDAEKQIYQKSLDKLNVDQKRLSGALKQMDIEDKIASAQRKRLTGEYVKLKPYRQNLKKHLIYKEVANSFKEITSFWQGRYVLDDLNTRSAKRKINLVDLFQNKAKTLTIPKAGTLQAFHELSFPYALMIETSFGETRHFLQLVTIDPSADEVQVIQTIERERSFNVFVDSSNPKKFVLRTLVSSLTVTCMLINGRIQIEDEIEWDNVNQMRGYSNGQLLGFWRARDNYSMDNLQMRIFDLEQNKKTSVNIGSFPNMICSWHYGMHAWIGNRCFVSVQFKSSENYGVAVADPETQNWSVVEFASKLPIWHFQQTNNHELMLYAMGSYLKNGTKKQERRVFKLPMQKPDRLRCIAWFKFVELMEKTKGGNDPNRKARMRLPFNSDLQLFKCIH